MLGAGIAGLAFIDKLGEAAGLTIVVDGGPTTQKYARKVDVARGSFKLGNPNRYRRFGVGGTSSIWGGNLIPFTREELDSENWGGVGPETHDKLIPALGFFGLKAEAEEISSAWEDLISSAPGRVSTQRMFRKKENRRITLQTSTPKSNVKVIEGLHAVDIQKSELNGKRFKINLVNGAGEQIELHCNCVIIATGGLEAIRLLYNSPNLAIDRSKIGHGFSCHISAVVGVLISRHKSPLKLETRDDVISNEFLHIHGSRRLDDLSWKVTLLDVRNSLLELLPLGLRGFAVFILYLLGSLLGFHCYLINVDGSQTPTPESRVFVNRGGLLVKHAILKKDLDNLEKHLSTIREYFMNVGESRFFKISRAMFLGKSHHLGGLSMANTSNDGLVSRNLELFGEPGVFVLSSAIFPTYSSSNPTLHLVQMALRLTDLFNKPEEKRI